MTLEGVVPWPTDLAHAYRAAGCWRGRTLGSAMWDWAQERGDTIAVTDANRRMSYVELAHDADMLAEGLTDLGLDTGDAILVQLPNCWEFVVVTFACFRLGVIPVMMLPSHREYELVSIGAHVRAKAIIVPDTWKGEDHQGMAERVAATLPDPAHVIVAGTDVSSTNIDLHSLLKPVGDPTVRRKWLDEHGPLPSDVAVFLLSGGTTGVPKVIARTHDDYDYNIRLVSDVCGFGTDTVYLAALPAGHNFPLANPGILGAILCGGRAVMQPSPRPDAVFETIEAERVTHTSAVPAVALKWMEEAATTSRDISSLRTVQVGGSVLAPETAARIGPALGCRLQQVYGMAEGLICYTRLDDADEVTFGTQGAPVSPYDELLIADAVNGVGELLTRGPYTPRGYFDVPEQNRLSFTPDGWYRTGDLVRLTPEGNIVVCGRVKDLINRGGEKISAGEIELLVQEMPQVADAAAVPSPDPELGERVCLFVRLHSGHSLTLADVSAALTARGLAAFKIPERLEVLDELPLTPVGKPDKKALRALVNGHLSTLESAAAN